MIPLLLPLLQSVQAAPSPAPLPTFSATERCPRDQRDDPGDDVVVCGSTDRDRYRLKPVPPRLQRFEGDPASRRAETSLGGGTLGLSAQQGSVGGIPSPRVMLGWKRAF